MSDKLSRYATWTKLNESLGGAVTLGLAQPQKLGGIVSNAAITPEEIADLAQLDTFEEAKKAMKKKCDAMKAKMKKKMLGDMGDGDDNMDNDAADREVRNDKDVDDARDDGDDMGDDDNGGGDDDGDGDVGAVKDKGGADDDMGNGDEAPPEKLAMMKKKMKKGMKKEDADWADSLEDMLGPEFGKEDYAKEWLGTPVAYEDSMLNNDTQAPPADPQPGEVGYAPEPRLN